MRLTSPAFADGASIPSQYTCDGNDSVPPLVIDDVPPDTKSFVLICFDPDSPSGNWDHWVAFDIPADTREINSEVGTQGVNSWGKLGYGGPCPGSGEHRYFFRLFALDTMLNLKSGASRSAVEQALQGHELAKTEVMGRYIKIENQ
ncbi:YbhB/YbcL family Raf kinase inhibitor-like protein [Patescibacteria group bacterium]|jgi:hypothetical protein|nr:YbhB/YbcL family Raf kinase inhibitor-like protein [Patescibacteria group bacterium]